MKILITCGNRSLGIFDDRNYVVFDKSRPKEKTRNGKVTISYDFAFYSRLDQAVREVSRQAANDSAESLDDWLLKFHATIAELVGLFTAEERLLDLQGYSLVRKKPKQPTRANSGHTQGQNSRSSGKPSPAPEAGAGRALGRGAGR